ncbi:hypothetical protein [Bartonella sp. CB169]|uniref:hypothetical protein n=1 Tax=Bartonella sp. CB169 TaxID=3112257 RepID=UPI00300DC7A7
MAHRTPTIKQLAITRTLREAKKQSCQLIGNKPTGEPLIYTKSDTQIPNSADHPDKLLGFVKE